MRFDRLRRRRHVPYRFQYSTAYHIARYQCKYQSDKRHRRQDQQHVSKKLLLECDRLEKMQIENLSAALERQTLVIRHRLVRLDQTEIPTGPKRRVPFYILDHIFDRRKLRVVLDDRAALDVRHTQHHALRHRVTRPKAAVEHVTAPNFFHRMLDRTLHRQLRLVVE